jgi:hypothetical protein
MNLKDLKYVLCVQSKEAPAGLGRAPMTEEGDWFLVMEDVPDHWVEATAMRVTLPFDPAYIFNTDVKVFDTAAEAAAFAQRWGGHPWWCRPNGTFQIYEVSAHYKVTTKHVGYRARGTSVRHSFARSAK